MRERFVNKDSWLPSFNCPHGTHLIHRLLLHKVLLLLSIVERGETVGTAELSVRKELWKVRYNRQLTDSTLYC